MHFNKVIKIGEFKISESSRTFIIAEAGVNHDGDINVAKRLVDVALEAGADAVKFQAFKARHLVLREVGKAAYQLKMTDPKESQLDMLERLELSVKDNIELNGYCKKKGILFLTTPFDDHSLKSLDVIGLSAYKVASTDITNLPFLKKIAKKGKPVILSTGMSSIEDVQKALGEIRPYNKDVILLQCSAGYPIKDNEANLNVIKTFIKRFNMLVGYSDHSVGVGAAPYAVAIGAKVIEKHFTLSKNLAGPDHGASLSPEELFLLVKEVRKVERYMGSKEKGLTISERSTRAALQKCLVAKKNIKKGDLFNERNIGAKRTGGVGISPAFYRDIFQNKADRDYKEDEIIEI